MVTKAFFQNKSIDKPYLRVKYLQWWLKVWNVFFSEFERKIVQNVQVQKLVYDPSFSYFTSEATKKSKCKPCPRKSNHQHYNNKLICYISHRLTQDWTESLKESIIYHLCSCQAQNWVHSLCCSTAESCRPVGLSDFSFTVLVQQILSSSPGRLSWS